jgi:hypothetical protein
MTQVTDAAGMLPTPSYDMPARKAGPSRTAERIQGGKAIQVKRLDSKVGSVYD